MPPLPRLHFSLYASHAALAAEFPARVAEGPRVLKCSRGNGGIGASGPAARSTFQTPMPPLPRLHFSTRGPSATRAGTFLAERAADFAAGGPLVDQPFQARHLEGMVRCYVVTYWAPNPATRVPLT
jgi:hypothetical protein